ncbi:MAG: PAS domain-containing protein [Bacteroidota bacterium]
MRKILVNTYKKPSLPVKITGASFNYDSLRLQAFDNAAQANIISAVSSGQIVIANHAARKLLGYSRKQLLTKSATDIFNINNKSFLKNLRQRKASGHNTALVIAIKKNGKLFPAEIAYSVFTGDDQKEKAIITFSDRSQSILDQTGIDIRKEKIVAANIVLAKLKQKKIDTKNEKIVTDNIASAKSKQKRIDTKNEKIVTDNIASAKSKQKKIDTKNEKIVTDNIASAKSKQKKIDTKNEKIVTDNIASAKSEQKKIDTKNEKIVAGNIIVAKAKSDDEKREQEIAAKENNTKNFKLYFNSFV